MINSNVHTIRVLVLLLSFIETSLTYDRRDVEDYLVNLYQFENTIDYDAKINLYNEIFIGIGEGYDDYNYESTLGLIVKAGPKTRAYRISNFPRCGHLKKLYQWFNKTTKASELTLDYRNVTNRGDRQPLGFCAAKKGVCGADLPLYVYSGIATGGSGQQKLSYFYSTKKDYSFLPDRALFRLVSPNPFCYLYKKTGSEKTKDQISSNATNLHLENFHSYLRPVYEFGESGEHKAKTYGLDPTDHTVTFQRHAFNLLSINITDQIKQMCYVRLISEFKELSTGTNVITTNETTSARFSQNTKEYQKIKDLGYGIGLRSACQSHTLYKTFRNQKDNGVYIASSEDDDDNSDQQYENGFFYSL
ncbi:hypothetical protein M3Y95_00305300 [Aphelenchoides besseyi]|nr:hypothetical protein M3Y95_00305300 [Aphelenchoides besseyi]